jgi:MFS transporter, PAT family, beta-lactamase induction signal transducer AmpG
MQVGPISSAVALPDTVAPKPGFAETLSVYLRPRVLIVMFLGFSSGLPLALTSQTLSVWMSEVGVDLRTIGIFALVGTPYTIKFLWAPAIDALDVPVLSRLLGRRRGWLLLTQLLLIVAIVFLALCDPATSPWLVAFAALMVATASATQDIVVDAFRVESLNENEQAAGMASYVAFYRVAVLISTAGALILVSGLEGLGLSKHAAWSAGYLTASLFVLIGVVTTFVASEPEKSAAAERLHAGVNAFRRLWTTVVGAFVDFFFREGVFVAVVVLTFVVLFKLTDALAGIMTPPFVIRELGFSRNEYAAIIKGVGFIASLGGGFAGGFVARVCPLATSLWIGGILQAVANLGFSWQAVIGHDIGWLTFAITVENFTSAIGTVIFVAYLSALCRNPLHTAMQYALLSALAAFGRTYLSAASGDIVIATGWVWFFVICALAALPSFGLLAWLQYRGHFKMLVIKKE